MKAYSETCVSDCPDEDHSQENVESVLIDVVKTTVQVVGLSFEESQILLTAWERCKARLAPVKSVNTAHPTIERSPSLEWKQFHENLVSWITRQAIESGRGNLFMFHAAALCSPSSGASIVLAAESGTGKTTATRVLATELGYITDETAAFDTDGVLYPYAKPLSILTGAKQRPKTQFSPAELELQPYEGEARVATIAVLDRDRSGLLAEPIASKLSLGEALNQLIPQMSSLSYLDRGLVQLCQLIDSLGGVVQLRYAEASELAAIIKDLLGSPRASKNHEWSAADIQVTSRPAPAVWSIRRQTVDDAIWLGPDLGLLKDEQYILLTGIGPFIWDSLSDWKTFDELFDAAIITFGSVAHAKQILHEQLESLCSLGILERA